IDQLLFLYAGGHVDGVTDAQAAEVAASVANQIATWQSSPFEPYAVARLRQTAFSRLAFRKYLDNLLAWGDSLFRQYPTETVNEATLLYSVVRDLLGPRPQHVEVQAPAPLRYADRAEGAGGQTWDDFADVLDDIADGLIADLTPAAWDDPPPVSSPSLYFC